MENQLPEPIIQVPFDNGEIKIHTFISPENFLADATHIIETKSSLIVVDGQFVVPYSSQFRAYCNGLGKLISRVYLSHDHPDHFFGIGASFSDCQIYALPETIEFLEKNGEAIRKERASVFGPFVPDSITIPQNAITVESETVEGIHFEYAKHIQTETEFHLSIKLPDLKVFILQDLIYSGGHIYLTKDFDNWIAALQFIYDSDYTLFLAGHGLPCGKEEIKTNIEYLSFARDKFNSGATKEELKEAILAAYPSRAGAAIIDIYLPRLYGEEKAE